MNTNLRKKSQRAIPLNDKKCKKCGATKDLQRHHKSQDYLDVDILCRSDHVRLHQLRGDYSARRQS